MESIVNVNPNRRQTMSSRYRLGMFVLLAVAMGVACSGETEQESEIANEVALAPARIVYYAIPG